jgi:hypothetical protein
MFNIDRLYEFYFHDEDGLSSTMWRVKEWSQPLLYLVNDVTSEELILNTNSIDFLKAEPTEKRFLRDEDDPHASDFT